MSWKHEIEPVDWGHFKRLFADKPVTRGEAAAVEALLGRVSEWRSGRRTGRPRGRRSRVRDTIEDPAFLQLLTNEDQEEAAYSEPWW